MDTTAKDFRAGMKVRTVLGEIKAVADAYGCQVIFTDGDWAHPAKCFVVKGGK